MQHCAYNFPTAFRVYFLWLSSHLKSWTDVSGVWGCGVCVSVGGLSSLVVAMASLPPQTPPRRIQRRGNRRWHGTPTHCEHATSFSTVGNTYESLSGKIKRCSFWASCVHHIGGQVLSVEVGTDLLLFSLIPRPSATCVYYTRNQTNNKVLYSRGADREW